MDLRKRWHSSNLAATTSGTEAEFKTTKQRRLFKVQTRQKRKAGHCRMISDLAILLAHEPLQ